MSAQTGALDVLAPARRPSKLADFLRLARTKTVGSAAAIILLLAFAIVASLLVGGTLPFFGGVVGNIVGLVKDLGSNGLVGLIAVGIIMWLFSKRSMA